jgi:hypothetical protein
MPHEMPYDPNDRNQRHILIVPPGGDLWETRIQHMMRTGYGGGFFVYFQRTGETPQQTVARVRELD